jgi:peptidoglycan/xylan/chitin deacetylase (PgdA/CDA1 family)
VPPAVFRQQMYRLARKGYKGISVRDYLSLREETTSPSSKAAVLTFDDGQRDFYTFAYPVLQEIGFSATIFIITDYVGSEKWFDPLKYAWSDQQPHKNALLYRFLDWDQLGELDSTGFEIGAHTCTHPSLPKLADGEQLHEIGVSKAKLEHRLGGPVNTFCYPFGHFNKRIRETVIDAGFQAACSTIHGLNYPETDPFVLRRHGIPAITGVAFDAILTDKYTWYYRLSRKQRWFVKK